MSKDHHRQGVSRTKSSGVAGEAMTGGPHCEKLGSNMQQCTVVLFPFTLKLKGMKLL